MPLAACKYSLKYPAFSSAVLSDGKDLHGSVARRKHSGLTIGLLWREMIIVIVKMAFFDLQIL